MDLFMRAAEDAGLVFEGLPIADGKWHRAAVDSDMRGKMSGSYVVSASVRYGFIQNFKEPHRSISWHQEPRESDQNRTFNAAAWNKMHADLELAEIEAKFKVADFAAQRVSALNFASDRHPYLRRKQVGPHGLLADGGSLVMPLRDINGKVWSAQTIYSSGDKINMKGGRKSGCFYLVGDDRDIVMPGVLDEHIARIAIAEGFATAASIHEATGLPVAVAVDSGNLVPVATLLREKYPAARIVVCGDDDRFAKCGVAWSNSRYIKGAEVLNAGRVKANEAAMSVGGVAVFPAFHIDDWVSTDFNDAAISGVDIAETISNATPRNESRMKF